MAKLFKGSGVALVTPFYKTKKGNLKVDYDALKDLVKYHKKNNTDAIIICGTTGEASTLSDKEHIKTIKKCVEYANGKIPVIAGTGSNDTKHAVYMSKEAEDVGADGLLCVTPYYNKTNQEGLKLYYKRISDNVDIPVIMYNVPSRTGVNILPKTAIDIANENENVVAIKEASGNIEQVREICESKALDVYSGNDDQIVPIMSLGGKGVISVLANVIPMEVHEMTHAYLNGDTNKACKLQLDNLELSNNLFIETNPIPVKTALNMMGMNVGPLRLPLYDMDSKNEDILKATLKKYNLI